MSTKTLEDKDTREEDAKDEEEEKQILKSREVQEVS